MIRKRRGLIVEVTEWDLLFSSGNVLTQLVMFSFQGLAVMMAEELRRHRVAALAITPGYLRSESMLQHFWGTEENWRAGGKRDPNFLEWESPLFLGRVVAAPAQDRKVLARSGELTSSWELGREYGFTEYLELTTLKQVVKWLVDEEHLPATCLIRLGLAKPRGQRPTAGGRRRWRP
jgi:hypothetical protein